MSTGKPRSAQKERFWRQTIEHWQQSGRTVRGFCREHGLAEANFHAWRRTLVARDAQAMSFAAVDVLAERSAMQMAQASTAALELVLANGRTVRVGAGFDAATLQRLLPLVEDLPPC
jgi:transposase-like protein